MLFLYTALLVLALVVIRAAAARQVARNLTAYFWLSIAIATFNTLSGLVLAGFSSLPAGAASVLTASVIFYLLGGAPGRLGTAANHHGARRPTPDDETSPRP